MIAYSDGNAKPVGMGVSMIIWRLPGCMIGRHRRNGRGAIYDNRGTLVSTCKGCGRPMFKTNHGWTIGVPDYGHRADTGGMA